MKYQIKKLRLKAKLKQSELSKLLGYESSSTIAMWESGERKPPSDKLPKLASILNCRIEDLYRGEKDDD